MSQSPSSGPPAQTMQHVWESFSPATRFFLAPLAKPLAHALRLPTLLSIYKQVANTTGDQPQPSPPPPYVVRHSFSALQLPALESFSEGIIRKPPAAFAHDALQELGISLDIVTEEGASLQALHSDYPLVVVSNHPFGALEGLALMSTLLPIRPDTLLLANYLLRSIPEIRNIILPVNPFSTKEARRENISALRSAMDHLRHGGCLCVFPAGEVSHLQVRRRTITDPAWNHNIAGLIRRTNAAVLPLHFEGHNSILFHLLGLLHPALRTAMLPSELLKKRSSTIRLHVGRIIPPNIFRNLLSEKDIIAYLRARSYGLSQPGAGQQAAALPAPEYPPVAPSPQLDSLLAEIDALPDTQILVRENGYLAFEAEADQIPNFLYEIGRQRELTFREVGEGSGQPLDTDDYDALYNHIILWHEKDQRIAGAYRIGQTGRILPEHGIKGLYSSTLFRFKPRFFAQDTNALELGRAFVTKPYQRDYAPLMLLWKGIARFVRQRPGVRRLFGPVSVSLEYSPYSLNTLAHYLRLHHLDRQLAGMVSGRKPLRYRKDKRAPGSLNLRDMHFNGLCNLVKDVEGGRTVPILFKHYLKLGGKIGAFHVDTIFKTLDVFLCIDLAFSPYTMLQRYMGKEEAERFLRECSAQKP